MKLLLLLILCSFSVYAQKEAIFDRNCESYAREKKFIHPKSVLDLDKRTERYFLYDNLTPAYGKMVDEVNKFAPGYYKTPDRAPIHACTNTPLNKCLSFQAYCTETIAKAAVTEDLAKWKIVATNCQNPQYRAKNPKAHCQYDAVKQLQYVYDQTLWLAKYEAKKNPDAARFFKESAKEFARFRDNMKALLAEQEKIEAERQEKLRQQELQKELAQTMKNCADIVAQDDNDVENRNIVGRVVVGLDCQDSLATLNQPQLNELKKDIDNILDHMNTKVVLNQTNAIALEKSSSAYWASKRQLDGTALATEKEALDLICKDEPDLCKNPLSKKTLTDTYRKNQQNLKAITPLTEPETSRLLETEFNPLVAEVNKACQIANKEWLKIQTEKGLEHLNRERDLYTAKVDNLRVAPRVQPELLLDKQPINFQNDDKPDLLTAAHVSLQNKFSKLLNSKLGHLMMSKHLQEKVGVFSPETFRKNCTGGTGKLLRPATLADLQTAKKDFKVLLKDELEKVADAHDAESARERKKTLETYLKNNPLTIAELLRKNPSPDYAKLMCHLIRDINQSDENWTYFKTGVAVVGTVASVALAATGVGAPVGALLFATVTSTTLISATASLDDYLEAKQEERYALQAGATNQDTKTGALTTALKNDEKADNSFKDLAITVVSEAAGFGVGKAFKYLKGPKSPTAITHAIDDAVKLSDDVIEHTDDVIKVTDKVVTKSDDVIKTADDVVETTTRTPAVTQTKPKIDLDGKQLEPVHVELDLPKVKVKTRPANVKSTSRLDYEKMSPSQRRYYDYVQNVDPKVKREIIKRTESSTERLAELLGNNNPKDVEYLIQNGKIKRFAGGGEADIFVSPTNKTEALKIWHPNRLDDFELSTKTVMHFEKKVEQNAKIAEVFHVSRIKEKGPNYIVKEFFENSIEISKVKNLPEVKAAMKQLNQQLLKNSDVISQRLYQNILKGSDNIHWDPQMKKIVLIDALGF